MPKFMILARTARTGGGWRNFKPVMANSPKEAVLSVWHDEIRPLVGTNERADGTPERPFITRGSSTEVAAVPMGIEESSDARLLRIISEAIGGGWQHEANCYIGYVEDAGAFGPYSFEDVNVRVVFNYNAGSHDTFSRQYEAWTPGDQPGVEDYKIVGIEEFVIKSDKGATAWSSDLQRTNPKSYNTIVTRLMAYLQKHSDLYREQIEEACADEMSSQYDKYADEPEPSPRWDR